MDIQVEDWTDDEVLEILHENYYTLGTTGEQAVLAVLDDIIHDRFRDQHGMSDERMSLILVRFARDLKDLMDITAYDHYKATKTDEG